MVRGSLAVVCVFVMALASLAQAVHYPLINHGDLPSYPLLARALYVTGTVEIQIVIAKGIVSDAEVKSVTINCRSCTSETDEDEKKVGQYLSDPSVENIKNWRFDPEKSATIVVRYLYRIEGRETERPENPEVEVVFPLILITAKPVKPTALN
jgi:hypothetical protein